MKLIANPIYLILIVATIGSGFIFIGTALTGLLLLIWLVLSLYQIMTRASWNIYPLTGWMLAYLGWLGVVVWWSNIPQISWMNAWLLAGLPIAFLAWGVTPNPDKVWTQLRGLLLFVGPVFAMWGLGQVVTGYGNGQPVGPLIDKNAFAALMNLFWFMASLHFMSTFHDESANRWRSGSKVLGLFLISMILFATESRGATLTWLLLMPVALWVGYHATQNKRAVGIVVFVSLAGYLAAANLLDLNIGNRSLNFGQDTSTNARLMMWKSAAWIVKDYPITGTGWGTFASYYPAYRDPRENVSSGMLAHNDYLQLATEGGVPALGLVLGIVISLLLLLKRALVLKKMTQKLEATGLLLATLALFIHANLNFIFYFSFMNILAGLFVARAAQIINPLGVWQVKIASPVSIGKPVRLMLVSLVALLLAGPLVLHLLAQTTLTGTQPGLGLLRVIWPSVDAYTTAKFISSIRPSSGIAQEIMLRANEEALENSDGISMVGGDFQRELLSETLNRYELVRAQTANSPAYGVREARILIQYRNVYGQKEALSRARKILRQNLSVNPFHVDSMIELSRLEVVEMRPQEARQFLIASVSQVLSRRDQQLLKVEILRQLAAPRRITELDSIEQQLRNIRSEAEIEVGKALRFGADPHESIEARLLNVAKDLDKY